MKHKVIACLLAASLIGNMALPVTAGEVLIVEDAWTEENASDTAADSNGEEILFEDITVVEDGTVESETVGSEMMTDSVEQIPEIVETELDNSDVLSEEGVQDSLDESEEQEEAATEVATGITAETELPVFEELEDFFVEEIEVSTELSLDAYEEDEEPEEEDYTCGPNLTWELDEDEKVLTISGTGVMDDWDNADTFAPWYDYSASITEVVIRSGVTTVGNRAFEDCDYLTSVSLPTTINRIGEYAFTECYELTDVDLNPGLTWIGDGAFSGCESLDLDSIPSTVYYIGAYAFSENAMTECVIPNSVTMIDESVFQDCSKLTTVTLPDALESINAYAFSGCSSLVGTNSEADFTIPESVNYIGAGAFDYCESLKVIYLPEKLAEIDDCCFRGCTDLSEIKIPETVTRIGDEAFFDCDSLEKVTIPKNVSYVGIDAFADCDLLTEVTFTGDYSIPVVEDEEGEGASLGDVFGDDDYDSEEVRELKIYYPASNETWTEEIVETLPTEYEGVVIEWIPMGIIWELEDGVLTIIEWNEEEEEAETASDIPWYEEKDSVRKIVIEEDVEKIGDYAFWNMLNVHAVWIEGDGIDFKIDDRAFFNVTATVFIDYDEVWFDTQIGENGQYDGALNWIRWGVEGEVLTVDEVYQSGYMTGHENDTPWSGNGNIVEAILKKVTILDRYWFYDCENLKYVTIPDTVTTIGDCAFSHCYSLKGIQIPGNVNELGAHIFRNCYNLKHVVFPEQGLPSEIAENAFSTIEVSVYYKMPTMALSKEYLSTFGNNASWIRWGTETRTDGIKELYLDGYGKIADFENPETADEREVGIPWTEGKNISALRIGDEITEIGAYAFYDFGYTKDVSVGKSVTFVREYAFAIVGSEQTRGVGGEIIFTGNAPTIDLKAFGDSAQIKEADEQKSGGRPYIDIYYDKNKTGWTSVIGQEYENYKVSWIHSEEAELFEGGWPVAHIASNFATNGNADEGYYLSKADRDILFTNLSNTQRFSLVVDELSLYRYNLDGTHDLGYLGEWGGSCYGLSHMIALGENGTVPDVWSNVSASAISNEVKSKTTFYHIQQFLDQRLDTAAVFMKKSQQEQLEFLMQELNRTNMVSVCFAYGSSITDMGGHAVLAYGIEEGRFWADDKYYNHRVLIYDVNEYNGWRSGSNYHTHALYFNDGISEADQWIWTIPEYDAISTTNKMNVYSSKNNAKFTCISGDVNFMNAVSHDTGTVNITAPQRHSFLRSGNDNFSIFTDADTYQISSGLVNGQYAEGGDLLILPECTGKSSGGVTAILPEADADYTISTNEKLACSMLYQDTVLLGAVSDQAGAVSFSKNGTVDMQMNARGAGSISVVSDDENINWEAMIVTVEDADDVTVQIKDGGIVVEGDNLYNMTIEKEEDGQTVSETFSAEDSVLVTSESNRLVVKSDSDQDGTYDKELNPHTHTYLEAFEWDASNRCKLVMSCSGCDLVQSVSCTVKSTVKDSTCTTPGNTAYTASAVFGNKSYTDTKNVSIPKKGHSYSAPTFKWSSDNKTASASFKCTRCAEVREENCNISSATTAATCTAPGKTIYTATASLNDKNYTDSRSVSIPVKGHTYADSWTTTKAATAVSVGEQVRKCKYCTVKDTQTIKKLDPTMTLNASSLVLKVKQKTTALKVTGLAAGDSVVSYKSSNKKIFTVSKTGKITAKNKVGSAKLTITLASGHSKTIKVKVQKAAVTTKKITVLQKNLTLKKGAKVTLQPILDPITSAQKITFATSNKKVATVNAKGVVNAKKKGSANITVKSGKKKVTVKVKVK